MEDPSDASGDALLKLIDKAHDEMVAAMHRQWYRKPPVLNLSIPCRPFDDTDALVCGVLMACKRELQPCRLSEEKNREDEDEKRTGR